jgi:hypothetical protein
MSTQQETVDVAVIQPDQAMTKASVRVLEREGVWVMHLRNDFAVQRKRPFVISHAPSGAALCAGSKAQMQGILQKLRAVPEVLELGAGWDFGAIDKEAFAAHAAFWATLVPEALRGTVVEAAAPGTQKKKKS